MIAIWVARSKDCIISVKSIFDFEFETANQPGFEPRLAGQKGAMLTIELHSIEFMSITLCLSVSAKRTNSNSLRFLTPLSFLKKMGRLYAKL